MAILKTYSINDVIIGQLHSDIETSGAVTNFNGLTQLGNDIGVVGDSMDEVALDVVIAAHAPDTTKIVIENTVVENKIFADTLMQKIKEKNISEGLSDIDQSAWVHHKLRKIDYTLSNNTTVVQIDLMNLIVSGDIETADSALGQMVPDDMTESYHWFNQDRIDWIRNEIRTYLGWPAI